MLRCRSASPENTKDTHTECDSVDFVLTFENLALAANSIRLEADLKVQKGATSIGSTDEVCVDPSAGAHSFFQSMQTEFQSQSIVEHAQECPRYAKMSNDALPRPDDTLNSENACELRSPDQKLSQVMLQGVPCMEGATDNGGHATVRDPDFSVKPKFCLNSMSGPLSYDESGAIRVTVKLARNAAALCGNAHTDAQQLNCQLSNLRLCFISVPEPAKKEKVQFGTKLNIKQAITSKFANMSTKVPAVCNAVSCSFQKQNSENDPVMNNLRTEVLPNASELQFLFNDSQDQYVTHQIKDREELLLRCIQSFADVQTNNLSLSKLASNDSCGVGMNFRDFVNSSNQKFNVQLVSDVLSTDPHILHVCFHSMMTI